MSIMTLESTVKSAKFFFSQFQFNKDSSTVMATYIRMKTAKKYNQIGSRVFCVFLDLSKLFHKIYQFTLIKKLCRSNLSPLVIMITNYIYNKQYVYVVFDGLCSNRSRIRNETRQGASPSPFLINF